MLGRALERFVMRMLGAELTGTEAFCYQQKEDDNSAQKKGASGAGRLDFRPGRRAEMTQDRQDPAPLAQHSAHLGRQLPKPTRPVTLDLAMPLARMAANIDAGRDGRELLCGAMDARRKRRATTTALFSSRHSTLNERPHND